MHFEMKHVFDAPVDQVLDAMFAPELPEYLKAHMKSIREIKPLERKDDGATVTRRVRYVPTPIISSVGPKKIPPEALAFVEESTFDRKAKQITFKNVAEHDRVRKHLENGGTFTFKDLGGGKTERIAAGELKVGNLSFFLRPLGLIAEQIIYSNAQKLLNEEAKVFAEFLKQRTAAPAA